MQQNRRKAMAENIYSYLQKLKESLPNDLVSIEKSVNPANFEVTALLRHY